MKKLLLALSLSAFFMSCGFSKTFVTVRNATGHDLEVGVWLSHVYFNLEDGEEIEFIVRDEIKICTPYGVAAQYDVLSDNTIELHEDGYYWGENKQSYWTEGR